jgi:hypothetical protein
MSDKNPPPEPEKSSGFVFKNEEARELYERVERVIGFGVAQLFKDACILLEPENCETLSHKQYLIGHLLREMEGSIFDVIKPVVSSKSSAEIKSKADLVDETLTLLRCSDEGLGYRLKETNLHSVAHRDGLSPSKGISDEFRHRFEGLVKAYGELLRLCEKEFTIWHKQVDELLQKQHCPPKLKSELPRNLALLRYLFSSLDKPEWFVGLRKQGFLEYDADVDKRDWPQVHYLIKIADQLPREVLEVMMSVETDDPWLLRQFCDAAMKMPKEQCEIWAGYLAEHIPEESANAVSSFMYHLPVFITHLVGLKSELAFNLASGALDILKARQEGYDKFSTRMDRYHYQELLKDIIPRLTSLDTGKTADLLAEKLDRAIELGWSEQWDDTDASASFWLPAIEDHSQNQDHYLEGSIAVALRDVLESSLKSGGELEAWLHWLNDRRSLVYTRMSIHLVRLFGSENEIKVWLLNKELFDNSSVLHEYLLLMQHGFPLMKPDEQETMLSWIKDFPEYDWVQEEHREKHRDWQQYRRLAFILESLNDEWRKRYDELYAEMEEHDLDRLSFDRWMDGARFVADKSPMPPEEVAEMTVDELAGYLTSDIRFDDFREISERGLETAIEDAVAALPAKYVEGLVHLKNSAIKPLFIRGVTNGFIKEPVEPIADKVQLDWMQWCMELLPWEGEHDGQRYTRGHEDNKKVLLGYLDGRMSSTSEAPLPMECREQAFDIILAGMKDPDPSDEKTWGDPHSQAINSVRGRAMETALSYGLWVLNSLGKDGSPGFDEVSELRDLLDAHLDLHKEPSPAVRSCYGRYIPQLCWMDKDWLLENRDTIFPDDPELFSAAWSTYLLYGRCYRTVFDVLESIYERAIMSEEVTQCEKGDQNSKVRDANMRLCSHLVLFYAWEQIDLNEDGMLCRFMRQAASEYKTEVLNFMGRVLSEEQNLPKEVVSRFIEFNEWWQQELANEYLQGWKAFGEWFMSPYLDRVWKIETLVLASEHTAFSYRSDKILQALATDYFEEYPEQVIAVTENYIGHQLKRAQRWALDSRDALPEILRLGHHHTDEGVRGKTNELLGRLVSEGFMKYREIAEEKSAGGE